MEITVKTGSKINLALDVTGKREDGYHTLSTVMQTVSVYDYVNLKATDGGIKINCSLPYIPCNESNIAHKAARLFYELSGIKGGVEISIIKHNPICAGLGGGSGNGAGVLLGLNKLYGSPVAYGTLKDASVSLGADVPLFFEGGLCLCTGIGENIKRLCNLPECYIVILKDSRGVSTPKAFSDYDAKGIKTAYTDVFLEALPSSSLEKIGNSLGNVLFDVEKEEFPEICRNIEILKNYGAYPAMTGSGSAVFGLFADKKEAAKCLENERNNHERVIMTCPADAGLILQ